MNDTKPTRKRKRASKGAGTLYKRDTQGKTHPIDWQGAGAFWLAYSVPNPDGGAGKRIRQALRDADGRPITDRKQAEAERRRIMAPFQTGQTVETLRIIQASLTDAETQHQNVTEQARGGVPISQAWERYKASNERPDAGNATLRQYGFQWERFRGWLAKHKPNVKTLADIAPGMAQEYAGHLAGANVSANTFNKHIGLLALVFRVLADDAGITSNPWERITRKKQRSNGRRELTTEELRRIVQASSGELRLLLAIGIYTGLRLGDCATLRWDEVDLARGRILRIPNKTASNGIAVKIPLFRDLAGALSDAKQTARGEHVLPESAAIYNSGSDTLTDRVQRHLFNAGIDCHASGTGYQIERDTDGNPVMTDAGNVKLTHTGKRAVVRVGFHSLRHSFVSLCREANAPLSVVESIVGHSNPAMTRHYSHTSDIEADKAVQALPTLTDTDTLATLPARQPLPTWARELIESATAETWESVRAELLAAG